MVDEHLRGACRSNWRFYFKRRCESPEACAVCLNEMLGQAGLYTPCGHCFHVRCIRRWLERHETCPLCRAIIDPKSDVVLDAPSLEELIRLILQSLPTSPP